jgi:Domain of unknown function (DUF5103)
MKYYLLLIGFLFIRTAASAQYTDKIYKDNIKSVKLYQFGNQFGFPVMTLNSGERIELHFDDMEADVKYYYYTFQLCNADWTPAMVSQFDFLKGYSQMRINTYRRSSIALTQYTHYEAILPDRNCYPTRSGNYILKVFTDGDTSKLILTKRFLVIDKKATISTRMQQAFDARYFRTWQKVETTVNTGELNVSIPNLQVKVMILQNNRWDNAIKLTQPTFIRRNSLEYSNEQECVFPGGKEWRWLDLRSLRLQSDRVQRADYQPRSTEVFLKPDAVRSNQRYLYFRDNNGAYTFETIESVNPLWQGDYAKVNFSFFPPDNYEYKDRDIYIFGELTNYELNSNSKMQFNAERGCYEGVLTLKQGYYNYMYAAVKKNDPLMRISTDDSEGNTWETENNYMVLVYYRSLGGRTDELVGMTTLNSLVGRQPGF